PEIDDGAGVGAFTATGPWTWRGGLLCGATASTSSNTGTLQLLGGVQLRAAKILNLNGTTNWNDADDCLGEGSKLNNFGTFNVVADNTFFDCGGAASLVTNMAGATLNRNGVPTQAAFFS